MATRRSQRRECTVCRDEKPTGEFPEKAPTTSCAHSPTVCTICLARHIEAEVNGKGDTHNVNCPSCRTRMQYNDIERAASKPTFVRYDMLLLRNELRSMPDFRYCKKPTCGSGQIHEGGSDHPIMKCVGCKALSCFKHDVPWHYEMTCEDFDATLEADVNHAATRAYVASQTKPCPECARPIEKNDGCDHMTCRRPGGCGHEFCWLCLAPFDAIAREGNHRHRPTCQYYAEWDEDDEEEDDD
ncbi:hypothetical protein DL93DRAFT_2225496 [Clavulina sp. PMI_390]|nr:hypothetical protein DL93DRAFT_2225496 [Clavulina sp. PMI_390]